MTKIINYQIEMLDVKSADCFIIYEQYQDMTTRLILVDAGNYSDGDMITDHINEYYDGHAIDLAIVTHPDDDHFGGFVRLLEKTNNHDCEALTIKKFWVNNPGNNHIENNQIKWINNQKSINVRAASVYDLKVGDNSYNLINQIESLKIPNYEKFAFVKLKNDKYLLKPSPFHGFTILGPTKEYYEELVPNFRNDKLNFRKIDDDSKYDASSDKTTDVSLSPTLDDASDDTSAQNKSSIIFMYEPDNGNKYLFMGDASVESFKQMPKLAKDACRNSHWLKVPHHGSKHNLNSEIIKWINPKVAYISTEKVNNYLSLCTINALKRNNIDVYSTHKDKATILHNGFQNRQGWGPATKC